MLMILFKVKPFWLQSLPFPLFHMLVSGSWDRAEEEEEEKEEEEDHVLWHLLRICYVLGIVLRILTTDLVSSIPPPLRVGQHFKNEGTEAQRG